MAYEYKTAHAVSIELADAVIEEARLRAASVEAEDVRLGRKQSQGNTYSTEESLARRSSGYLGEAALSLYLGLSPVKSGDHFNRPDVGGYGVRTTKRLDGCLIILPKDPLWAVQVLVIDECPWFHIAGCYRVDEARRHAEWWKEPRPGGGAWFVPQDVLLAVNSADDVRPIDERAVKTLAEFSHDWRAQLRAAGVEPPKPSPLSKAVVDRMAAEPYGSKNEASYNPGGLVVRTDVPPELATHHPRKEP